MNHSEEKYFSLSSFKFHIVTLGIIFREICHVSLPEGGPASVNLGNLPELLNSMMCQLEHNEHACASLGFLLHSHCNLFYKLFHQEIYSTDCSRSCGFEIQAAYCLHACQHLLVFKLV